MTSAVDERGLEASPKFRVLLTASLVSSPYHVRFEHRSGLAIERSLEASFADVVGDQRLGAQPVKVEADDVAARERSREQAGPLSVETSAQGDAAPQPLVHAFAVAARYRGERRFQVLFQQCQTRRLGQVNRPGRLKHLEPRSSWHRFDSRR